MASDCQPQRASTDVRPIFNGSFSEGSDAAYPAEKASGQAVLAA